MMFDETPPGQHPTRTSPTPTARGSPAAWTTHQATSGINAYWAAHPISMSTGLAARKRKSSLVSVSPIVSIMKPRTAVCEYPFTQLKEPGKKYAKTAVAATNAGVHFASQADMA